MKGQHTEGRADRGDPRPGRAPSFPVTPGGAELGAPGPQTSGLCHSRRGPQGPCRGCSLPFAQGGGWSRPGGTEGTELGAQSQEGALRGWVWQGLMTLRSRSAARGPAEGQPSVGYGIHLPGVRTGWTQSLCQSRLMEKQFVNMVT